MPKSKASRYWKFNVDSTDINNVRAALTHKFNDRTILVWVEEKYGKFYVCMTSTNGYVEKNIRNKLICLNDTQDIIPCTFDEIKQAIDSADVIYKQDNRKHQKNKKPYVPALAPTPIPISIPALTTTHTSANICGNPIFFDLDKSDDSLSDND